MKQYLNTVISNPRPAQALGINQPFVVFCFITSRALSFVPAIYWCFKCLHLAFVADKFKWLPLTSALWTLVITRG